ncbi:MAG: molybdopterin-dependent oxidoreductase, partial [bacterium]
SPALTNEEIFLSIMLAKEGLRSKGIYSFYLSPLNLTKKEEFPISTISLNEINKNSLIILHDLDLTRTAPIVGVKVRQAVKNGALLIAVDSSTKMFRMLDNVVSIGFDTRAIKEIIEKNAKNFNNAIVISKARPSSNKLTEWFTIRNLQHEFSLELAWGYLFVGAPANIQGLIDMFIPIDKEEMIPFDECMRMLKGGELSALIIGEDPIGAQYPYRVALEGASSLVVLDGYLTETASLADLFIPISLWHETAGTFTNLERRLRKLNKITEPPSGYSTISILEKIGNSFGIKLPSDPVTIFEKLSDEIKQYAEFEIDNVYDLNLLSVNCEKLTIPPAKEDFEHSIPESDTSYFQKALINYLKHKGLKNLPA